MRLSFPSGEHADVIARAGTTSIGSAQGNAIVLSATGVLPWHAQIVLDARGMVLEVLDPAARTHVNARPVLEKALLRLGDVISVNATAIVLKPDQDDFIVTRLPPSATRQSIDSRVVLRGVSGHHFGKAVVIEQRLSMGGARQCDLTIDDAELAPQHAAIEINNDSVVLRDLGSVGGTSVNGVLVRDAVLHSGDQLGIGRHRFVLEAPGFRLRGQRVTTPPPDLSAGVADEQSVAGSERSGVWWLILAAALIGVGIAALLMFGGH